MMIDKPLSWYDDIEEDTLYELYELSDSYSLQYFAFYSYYGYISNSYTDFSSHPLKSLFELYYDHGCNRIISRTLSTHPLSMSYESPFKLSDIDNENELLSYNKEIRKIFKLLLICNSNEKSNVKERKMNALSVVKNNVTSALTDGFKSKSAMVTDYAVQIAKSKLKDHFGKEYFLSNSTTDGFKNKKLLKFVEKFDPNFDLHYFKHSESLGSFVSIYPVRKDTFVYIATKRYVPDVITNAIVYGNNNNEMKYDMYIYIFGKKSKALCTLLDRILEDRKRCTRGNRIYNIYEVSTDHGNSITTIDLKHREMKNMYYSYNELGVIRNHIDTFMKNKGVYDEKQILYKTGILLYGEPGTGKSTLAKAIATEYHRSIVTIDMANVFKIDFTGLTSMINCDIYDEYIILLEDIDTLFLNRDENNSTDAKNYNDIINKLLQFLDSNTSPNNVIFIATTNHLNRLDEALLRDGRFDIKVEVKGLKEEDVHSMVESFGVDSKYIPEIIDKYNDSIHRNKYDYNLYNQSKLQNIIIKYI